MTGQEVLDELRLVARQIVGDEVDVTTLRLAGRHLREEGDKLGAGVVRGGLAQHLTASRVQGGVIG